jgi:hypothetical protein
VTQGEWFLPKFVIPIIFKKLLGNNGAPEEVERPGLMKEYLEGWYASYRRKRG